MVLKIIKKSIKQNIRILSNPQEEFKKLDRRSFESVVSDYMVLLIITSLAAGLLSFFWASGKAAYYDFFRNINIQYLRMLNYSLGRLSSILFLYLFMGTFALFFISMALKPFFNKIKYTSLLSILMYAVSPVLIFGWIILPPYTSALLLWSIFIFATGVKSHKFTKIGKRSIHMRE